MGAAEVTETIADGFVQVYGWQIHVAFGGSCLLLLAGAGALLGLAAAVCQLGIDALAGDVARRLRARSHLVWCAFMGVQLCWIAFLYGFKLFPLWGIAILPSSGLFNPVLPGTVALIGLSAATLPISAAALFRWARQRRTKQIVAVASVLLLYWQVSYALYAMSRISPANHLHVLSLVLLFALMISLVATPISRVVASLGRPRTTAAALAALVLLAPATHHLVGSHGPNTLRLLLHERTALTYRTLEWLPDTYAKKTLDELQADCPPADPSPQPTKIVGDAPPPVRGVVLVMIDALRSDLIGAQREGIALTPHLTELADDSLFFARTYATAAVTIESAASMLTGRHASLEQIGPSSGLQTFGHRLTEADVNTIAIPVHPMLNHAFFDFDIRDKTLTNLPDHRFALTAKDSAERVLHHVEQVTDNEKFFVFAHFYDPHWYYVPNGLFNFGPTERDRYDAEVAYTDHWIGHMLDELANSAHAQNIAVIIVGDHGEEFWEHKYIQHVVRLYDESIRVPLIVDHPHLDTPLRIDTPVSTTDIAPTVLELFDLPIPTDMTGRPLLGAARADELPDLPVRSSAPDKEAVVYKNHKLIINTDTGILELYNLDEDPDEMHNLADLDRKRPHVETLVCLM